MELKKMIIHEVIKNQKQLGAQLDPSRSCLELNPILEMLASRLIDSFNKLGPHYSIFDQNPSNEFQNDFNNYLTTDLNEADFQTFSLAAAQLLKNQISGIAFAKGGYLVFLEYEERGKHYISILLVRDADGVLFKKGGMNYDVNEISYVDTAKLAMACRINVTNMGMYDTIIQKYISLINSRNSGDLSSYFGRWLGLKEVVSNKEYTTQLKSIIEALPKPLDPDTGQELSESDTLLIAGDFINNTRGKVVKLPTLSEYIYGSPDVIRDYINNSDIVIDDEFIAHPTTLRKFYRISVKADDINISFKNKSLGTQVKTSDEDPEIVIIRSKKFANAIRRAEEENK
jgi:nucleoid-associated protein